MSVQDSDLWEKGIKRGDLYLTLLIAWWELPGYSTGRSTGKARRFPELGKWNRESRKGKAARTDRKKIAERERAARRDLLRSVEGPRWVLIRSASEETTWVSRKKNSLKWRKGANCCAHKGTGIVCVPITSGEKSLNSWWAGQSYSRVLP